ncbi:MAG: glycosyltransferase family 4 protein [Phycisphaerae bacterium]|nr:glycosyltransferase family 4 protein [Phycisphaerae bacterium]
MHIWLVNPFDPLPGDPEQEGRYATLARMLVARGHAVTWWTSSFSHRFKKPVDQVALKETCDSLGINLVFLESPSYSKNISIKRLWNHMVLAKQFNKIAAMHNKPDIILASAPPPFLAQAAVKTAKKLNVKSIVDIQDLWPETFYRLGPKVVKLLLATGFYPWHRASAYAYRNADAIVGVADQYVNRAIQLGANPVAKTTVPLGIDLQQFNESAKAGICEQYTKPYDEIWFAYTGSLNVSYDCLTLAKAFLEVESKLPCKAKLFITGRGQLADELKNIINEYQSDSVIQTGFLDFPQWAYLLSQCDIGFNASFPQAMIYLPNKIFYYFAAGLAVLNTIPGQCSQIVENAHCGLDYQAGNVQSCADAIMKILNDDIMLAAMKTSSASQASDVFDRNVLYENYLEIITSD